jgi:hypothetical protein
VPAVIPPTIGVEYNDNWKFTFRSRIPVWLSSFEIPNKIAVKRLPTEICAVKAFPSKRQNVPIPAHHLWQTKRICAGTTSGMPVIVPTHHEAWLSGEPGKEVLIPYPADRMKAWPISSRLNSPK